MKKIINGKVYDTEKARRLGYDGGGEGFSRWYEELYQKRTGEYFLYGEGGPMTRYADAISDNSWRGGEKIMPLSYEAARQWAEEHLSADDYEQLFTVVPDDDTLEVLHVQLPASLMARIRLAATSDGISLRDCITRLLSNSIQSE